MLIAKIFSSDMNLIDSIKPLSMKINVSLKIPAHSGVVIVPFKNYKDCAYINIYDHKGLLFKGVIDEEHSVIRSDGTYKRFIFRSMMCLLLDNEVEPVVIYKATQTLLGKRYMKPLSVNYIGGENIMPEPITCDLGTTIYQVMEMYCSRTLATKPYVSPEGEFSFTGGEKEEEVCFTNDSEKGISYSSYIEYKKPCHQITEIKYMMNNKGYKFSLNNNLAMSPTVPRVRYMDCRLESKTSVEDCKKLIDKYNKESCYVEISSPYQLIRLLGCQGIFKDKTFLIAEVSYTLSSSGEYSTLILESSGKEDENVADQLHSKIKA